MELPKDLVKSLEVALDDGPIKVTLGCGCSVCDADVTEDICFECGEEVTSDNGEAQRLADVATNYFRKENN